MSNETEVIPVVLFVYARPAHLRLVLASLRRQNAPLIYAFADGPKDGESAEDVAKVRRLLREYDGGPLRLVERETNLGLGANVLGGVTEIARKHAAFVVWEDDLVAVPGAYAWVAAALRHYENEPKVMSVTAWTHPLVTPPAIGSSPYFDGRAECWVWGAYARSWQGMERSAREKMRSVETAGQSRDAYGADLPMMVRNERRRNLWAVRWIYHHLQRGGLCLRPPWSMVEHIGFGEGATNALAADRWVNPPLRAAPPIPTVWPPVLENPECRELWHRAHPTPGIARRFVRTAVAVKRRAKQAMQQAWLRAMPESIVRAARRARARKLFYGDYADWAAAHAASGGGEGAAIVEPIVEAALAVRAGQAAFERDGVRFLEGKEDEALMATLEEVARSPAGGWRVIDFGGALGSTYTRHLDRLPRGSEVAWDVVEQPDFVAAGRRHLEDERLSFHANVRDAEALRTHHVLLCSGVLQYLEAPYERLSEWRELTVPYLVLHNLPLHREGPDRLRVQRSASPGRRANAPVWFFNRDRLIRFLSADYELVREYASEDAWPVDREMLPSTGLLLKKRSYRSPP